MMFSYMATIESAIHYGFIVWFGNLTVKLKGQIQNLIRRPGEINSSQKYFASNIFTRDI